MLAFFLLPGCLVEGDDGWPEHLVAEGHQRQSGVGLMQGRLPSRDIHRICCLWRSVGDSAGG